MKLAALLLILCIAPCFFIIPVFCGPVEISLSQETNFCFLMAFEVTSDTLILAETISYQNIPRIFTRVSDISELLTIPIFSVVKDRPS